MKQRRFGAISVLSISCLCMQMAFSRPCVGAESENDVENFSLEDLLNVKGTITASKQLQRVADAPATVIVITHDQILQRGYMNVKDVLADIPGMETIENSFAEFGTLVPVRGIVGNNKILLLLNGIPLNPPNRENLMLREDQSVRFAKRVEIVYGPGSALYGTDAVSAVVNIITLEPTNSQATALASYGSMNTSEGAVSYGTLLPAGNFQTYLQYYQSDGMNLAKEYPSYFAPWREAYDSNSKAGDEVLADRKKKGLNLFARYKTNNTAVQYWMRDSQRTSADGFTDGGLMFSKAARWRDHSDVMSMENSLHLRENISLKTSLTYSYYRIDPTSQYVFPISGSYFYGDNKYGRGSAGIVEEQLNWKPSKDVAFVFGFEYRRNEGVPKSSVNSDYDEHNSLTTQTGDITYTDSSGTHTAQKMSEFVYSTLGVYAQGDWTISRYLRAIAGARYNEMSLSDDRPIVPRLGLISPLNERTTLKLIHSEAFVYPALYFQNNVFDNGSQVNIANPNLKPEKSQTTELNLLYDAWPWTISSSVYYNRQKDIFLIEYFDHKSPGYLGAVTVGGNARDLYQTTNSGDSETYGVDTLTNYRYGAGSSAFLAMSYVNGKTHQLGINSRLDRISNYNVRVGSSYLIGQKFTVSPRFSWRSDPFVPDMSKSGSAAKASSEHAQFKNLYQLDLYTSYAPTKQLSIFARVNNLTNNKYLMRGLQGQAVVPAEGLRAETGAEYLF